MPKKLKPIPSFANEEEERRFWETHDSFDYVDWDNAVRVRFPNLKLSDETEAEQATPASESAAD
ncbi:MAG: hypothetical protein F4X66_14095 [Chloroflexi bacterium]|nr:hypothetical protein [Chloroflexota bacterium]MYE40344.1 hypothetical protein [Chloroflexota bacterium]